MRIGVLGINYKSAPLFLREQIAESCRDLFPNKIVLSTCYRTEIYISQDDLAEAQSEVFAELKRRVPHLHEHAFYTYFGQECFYHLACVTTGLDSALLAESDIQRQVKIAYGEACRRQRVSSSLHYLFQKALKLSKKVRSTFPLFQTSFRLEGMVYQLVHQLLGETPKLLFIGNSDINRKMIHYFWRKGKKNMALCTRDLHAAHPFALDYQLTLIDRKELENWHTYDGVIAATTSQEYLIKFRPDLSTTRLILDLSVPRSVNPLLQQCPDLTLLNMEEMGSFFENLHAHRNHEVQTIKNYLQASAARYIDIYERKLSFNDGALERFLQK
ncbi:MAG TPA: hypothetical protein VHA52_08155 [Candidatus Babeliaceae bacterium]|nr:hypothetical protein [Candidatus Babeliaceae bacterium]